MRYFFEISYNGTPYHGWQNQPNALSVQQVVEDCFTKVFRTKIEITGSGRTDTGVHCVSQYFHADVDATLNEKEWIPKLNSILPRFIAIRSILPVKPDASARYDAKERTYTYHITRVKNPILVGRAYYFFRPLDKVAMEKATNLLLGEHDFQCFSKTNTDVNHFICTIKSARWNQKGDMLVFTITANRFLRGMVRSIVGTLLNVGSGKTTLKQFQEILKSKDRKQAGMNVPADALYLINVKYPRKIFYKTS
ncbi:MAG: tRNA pseudouridine(38-40) synthase TruA [Cyclobacteriaceae bacterium]|nr:tRNA pseudouridine(38-40) synthase TruA [Cytophagales bacterium]MBX2900860.1 tRNA pseudouridine(38-40) synthase TruA [Cyclobacteriaceae bacterium]